MDRPANRQAPLVNVDFSITGDQLTHIGVTALIWIVLPSSPGGFTS